MRLFGKKKKEQGIKILGSGCSKCLALEKSAREALGKNMLQMCLTPIQLEHK